METSNPVVWYNSGQFFGVSTDLFLKVCCLLLILTVNCKSTFLEGFQYGWYIVQIASDGIISDLGSGGADARIMALWFTAVIADQGFDFSDVLIR